jgi:methyltransferase (TIGR00027 family)
MRSQSSSRTAEWIATLRGLSPLVPPAARLVDDPWGAQWTGYERLRSAAEKAPALSALLSRPIWGWILYMQVRSRVLDDAIRRFAQGGGRQLVLLGAGLDARALRLRELGLRVFEVDHPATHARKKGFIGDASTTVAWDFEKDPLSDLPARLASLGYDRAAPGCVIWEGVTMYLSVQAIEDSVAMLRDLLAPGSILAFTYFGRERLDRPTIAGRLIGRLAKGHGEPWKFGWDPAELPAWMAERGFQLELDDDSSVHAARCLPPEYARHIARDHRRIAVARRAPAA